MKQTTLIEKERKEAHTGHDWTIRTRLGKRNARIAINDHGIASAGIASRLCKRITADFVIFRYAQALPNTFTVNGMFNSKYLSSLKVLRANAYVLCIWYTTEEN